jgi:pyruvate dehydrogenase E2 component (dihydrolipoamide acetyltransferase)
MAVTITMPKLGLTMNSGSVAEWKKQVGEPVKKGEILYVVATDKLTVDVESPADGVLLAVTIREGEEVAVGAPIGLIGEAGEQAQPAAPAPAGTVPRESGSGRAAASPKAKKLAREMGVDLAALAGTGPGGWIVARDVSAAGALPKTSPAKTSPVAARMAREAGLDLAGLRTDGARVMKADVAAAIAAARPSEPAPAGARAAGERRVPVTQMRRIIGERMLASSTSIPAVTYFADTDMAALNAMRARFNARLAGREPSVRVSVNDILMKLCAKLLLDRPALNGSVEAEAFVMRDFVNIGFAVALPGGLLVPNIKNVQAKDLETIARERAELVAGARSGGLAPDSMTGGTFTISNLGMMGVDAFTPIINPPEAAILGVGMTRDIPVARNGEVVVRPVATLCLTADHRLVDGAEGASFLSDLREIVEDPALFLL